MVAPVAARAASALGGARLAVPLVGLVACAGPPGDRVHPGLFGSEHPTLPGRVVVLALPFDVGERLVDGVVEREETASERARDHLRAALRSHAEAHPRLAVVSVDDPADRARLTERERELDALVDEILRTGPVDRRTVEASLGPVLADWGERLGAGGLLVGRGLGVLPREVWDRPTFLDEDETTRVTVGVLQITVLLVDLPTGDVLWMDLHDELLGGEDAVWWPDVRDAWVADEIVGELLESLPAPPAARGG